MTDFLNALLEALTAQNERLEARLKVALFEGVKQLIHNIQFERLDEDIDDDSCATRWENFEAGELNLQFDVSGSYNRIVDEEGDSSLPYGTRTIVDYELREIDVYCIEVYLEGCKVELTSDQESEIRELLKQKYFEA